ncbi:uncharacterized protein LOC119072922 [Bradysia coprophila]|uniref:uncharacterized protein LOC119072922 n=1 Tax=Bradysia coprophila TaxID=38358 RepID=UPI00187DC5B9|nr:uncharacterized protein LOC119072922 [Bradysia coprophila]
MTTTANLELLPDDCVLAIFEWLTLDDLCAFSGTCKRFQMLGQQYFRIHFPNEVNTEVEVKIGSKGKICVSPHKSYLKCFQKFITNISIVSYDHDGEESEDDESSEDDEPSADEDPADERIRQMSLVVNFMNRKCNRINRICVEGDVDLDSFIHASGNKAKKILRSAETVVFKDRNHSGVDEAKFLMRCPNITTLIMEDGIAMQNCNAIFQQMYPKLEHFYYIRSYGTDLRIDNLKTFFRHHPKIKTVAWMFHYDDAEDDALKCLQMVDYVSNLEHMFLLIDRLLADNFNSICNYLNVLCNRENFQCLEIEFSGEEGAAALKANSKFLAKLKQCTKIHVTCMLLTEVIPALQSLTYLKTLSLADLTFEEDWNDYFETDDLVRLVDNTRNIDLPSIEEVHLIDMDDEHLYVYILQFVSNWSKLKRIFLPACIWSDTVLHDSFLETLSRQRKKLKNSCELTIFTNHNGNKTNLKHDLVKVKFAEFKFHPFRQYASVSDCE